MSPSEIVSILSVTIAFFSLIMVLIFNLINQTKGGNKEAKLQAEKLTHISDMVDAQSSSLKDIHTDVREIRVEQGNQNDRLTRLETRMDSVERALNIHKEDK